MTQGMDAGMASPHLDGLPTRVGHLENEMSALHEDNIRTRAAISTLGSQVDTLTDTMKDLAIKLDQQRTRRPDFGVLAAWAAVILTLGAMAYAPMTREVSQVSTHLTVLEQRMFEHAVDAGVYKKSLEVANERISKLTDAALEVKGNRFTDADGRALEDKLTRQIEKLRD